MLDIPLDADPPSGDSDSGESVSSEASERNQEDDNYGEEDDIDFTADVVDAAFLITFRILKLHRRTPPGSQPRGNALDGRVC